MGDTGVESKLVLKGLAKSKVRFYSTLNSDVGKQVVITDKFNPLRIFTGTFDESLNLLYDLPAFTSYQVKMYGLDGETVESNQTFMLKGYDYLEINVGLNKNSFAGIKAIVDQGLESSMLEVGHTWYEDDGANSSTTSIPWMILAIDYQPETEGYRHNVMIGRRKLIDAQEDWSHVYQGTGGVQTYYDSLPSKIKDTITTRNYYVCYWNYLNSQNPKVRYENHLSNKVWVADPAQVNSEGKTTANLTSGEYGRYSQFPAYAVALNRQPFAPDRDEFYNSPWLPSSEERQAYTQPVIVGTGGVISSVADATTQRYIWPHMMIASDPIAQNS